VQVNSSAGVAEAGDILTLTTSAPAAGCGTDTFTLEPTGPEGFSRTEVPFGTYTLTVKLPVGASSTTSTVTVSPGTVTIGVQYPLPKVPTVVGP
jgi:hypothetical protein